VGQAEEIGKRIESHYENKDFWNWCYAFVTSGNSLNRAHITWLEHSLLDRATDAKRCHLDNAGRANQWWKARMLLGKASDVMKKATFKFGKCKEN
jgi:hypothetical protein